ncbi:uncharacterized protein LOC143213804 [Lasioglossum baleicum]|uniref:uncharacterized protein LOC143213804 n=1 Tax=Lasioglossum baleicum TaxID=434251 RepID=UPI003FCC4425
MHFILFGVLYLSILASQVLSEENTYTEYSDQHPWSFVYAIYPFYNSETLLEIWKTEKSVDISANAETVAPDKQGKTVLYSDDARQNGTNLQTENVSYFISEAKNINGIQSLKNVHQLSSYKNKHKN